MGIKRKSYRNPFFSAFIFALLYLVISNFFHWCFWGDFPFIPFSYFNWFEYVLGTLAMWFLVLLLEFLRNLLGRKKD